MSLGKAKTRKIPLFNYAEEDYEEYIKCKRLAEKLEKEGHQVNFGKCATDGKFRVQIIGG